MKNHPVLFKLKNTEIKDNSKCMIIAELGTLHHHDYEAMKRVTGQCFEAGADAVKIQCIDPDFTPWADDKQLKRYRDHLNSFPKELWAEYLYEMNQKHSKPVYASVFDKYTVEYLKGVNPCFKIANRMINDQELLDAIAETKVPRAISIQDSQWDDRLKKYCKTNTLVMNLIPGYPVHIQDIKLGLFQDSRPGLSIHFNGDMSIYKAAFVLGCKALEVHVMGDKPQGADEKFAFTIQKLEALCYYRRLTEVLEDSCQYFYEHHVSC